MRRGVLTIAVLALVGLTAGTAYGRQGHRGYYSRPGYYARGAGTSYYARGAGTSWGGYYSGGQSYQLDSHTEAVRRIRANYSRYRYYTHPRSMYNAPSYGVKFYPGGWGVYGR